MTRLQRRYSYLAQNGAHLQSMSTDNDVYRNLSKIQTAINHLRDGTGLAAKYDEKDRALMVRDLTDLLRCQPQLRATTETVKAAAKVAETAPMIVDRPVINTFSLLELD